MGRGGTQRWLFLEMTYKEKSSRDRLNSPRSIFPWPQFPHPQKETKIAEELGPPGENCDLNIDKISSMSNGFS